MSEDQVKAEQVEKEEQVEKAEQTETVSESGKKGFFTDERLEVIVAIMLGITAVFTAWATWIASLHGGNQATKYAESNNLSSLGNSEWNEASQTLMQDMMFWNNYYEMQINRDFAEEDGNKAEAEKYQYMMDVLLQNNCSDGLEEAIEWAAAEEEATGYVVSPFEMEGFVDSYYEVAQDYLAQSEEALADGQKSNGYGDKFNLVTVIYAVVLFLLGIVGIFKKIPNRVIIVAVSFIGFLVATIYMFTIPLPFN